MPETVEQKLRSTEEALVCSDLEITEYREKLQWIQEIATVGINGHPVHGPWSHQELIRTLGMIQKGAGEALRNGHP